MDTRKLTVDEVIGNFEYCKAMIRFDEQTGETCVVETLNKDNRDLYDSLTFAIRFLSEQGREAEAEMKGERK